MNRRVSPSLIMPPVHALGPSFPEPNADNFRRGPGATGGITANGPLPIQGESEVSMYVCEHGFPRDIVYKLARFASEHEIVLVMHATNIWCAEHARKALPVVPPELEGQAVSRFGPLSGYVLHTRIDLQGPDRERSDQLVARYLKEQKTASTNLVISRRAIDDLARQGALAEEKRRNPGAPGQSWLVCEVAGKAYTFTATPMDQANNAYRISEGIKPIQVLGKDYGGYVAPYSGGRYCLLMSATNGNRPAQAGANEQLQNQLADLNSALGRMPEDGIVTSSANSRVVYPCLFFAPEQAGIAGVAYARNKAAADGLLQELKNAGYTLSVTPEPLAGASRGQAMRTALMNQYRQLSDPERPIDPAASGAGQTRSADHINTQNALLVRSPISVSDLRLQRGNRFRVVPDED